MNRCSMAPPLAEDLEEFWEDLRPGTLKPRWRPPSRDALRDWTAGLETDGSRLLTIEGPSLVYRSEAYRQLQSLPVVVAIADNWIGQTATASIITRPAVWGRLQSLVRMDLFLVDEPLQSLLNEGGLPSQLFQAIWEARFLSEEGQVVEHNIRALMDWIVKPDPSIQFLKLLQIKKPVRSRYHRLELFFLLLTLAKQNDILGPVVFVFDGLDRLFDETSNIRRARMRELSEVIAVAEKWGHLGAAIGVVLGLSKQRAAAAINGYSLCRRAMRHIPGV